MVETDGAKPRELARRPSAVAKVDPVVEPSAEWGWHQHFPRAARVLGVLVGFLTLGLLVASNADWTEMIYTVGTALILFVLVLLSVLRRRNSWRPKRH